MLRSIDIFPSPVGVRIDSGQTYKTTFGGILSILAILLIGFVSVATLLPFYLSEDEYKQTTVIKNLPYKNDLTFDLSDIEVTIAFQFVKIQDETTKTNDKLELDMIDKYLSYYFVKNDKVGVATKKDVIPIIICSDKYNQDAEGRVYDEKLLEQFET